MLQLPPLSTSNAKPLSDTAKSADSGSSGDTEFGRFLDQVTDQPLPPEMRAELMKQVADGVPIDEVLGSLVDRLNEDAEFALAPGMLPVLQTLAPPEKLSDLQALRATNGRLLGRSTQAEADIKASPETALDESEMSEELGELPGLLGKQKPVLTGRVSALEALTNAGSAVTATQALPTRGLDIPLLAAALPQQGDVDGPEGLLIPQKLSDPQWGQALAQRIVWMVGQDKQVAELRLNPANLGPLEVKLTLHQDQASVSFLASNGAVREALEQALPRLRDMLGQQDLQLAQVDVGQRQANQEGRAEGQGNDQRPAGADGNNLAESAADGEPSETQNIARMHVSNGLIDAYA